MPLKENKKCLNSSGLSPSAIFVVFALTPCTLYRWLKIDRYSRVVIHYSRMVISNSRTIIADPCMVISFSNSHPIVLNSRGVDSNSRSVDSNSRSVDSNFRGVDSISRSVNSNSRSVNSNSSIVIPNSPHFCLVWHSILLHWPQPLVSENERITSGYIISTKVVSQCYSSIPHSIAPLYVPLLYKPQLKTSSDQVLYSKFQPQPIER